MLVVSHVTLRILDIIVLISPWTQTKHSGLKLPWVFTVTNTTNCQRTSGLGVSYFLKLDPHKQESCSWGPEYGVWRFSEDPGVRLWGAWWCHSGMLYFMETYEQLWQDRTPRQVRKQSRGDVKLQQAPCNRCKPCESP